MKILANKFNRTSKLKIIFMKRAFNKSCPSIPENL